jgi:hypothetical protein
MLVEGGGKKIIELGVKPFSSLTPDTSVVRFNHPTFNQRPWQGLVPARGRALLKKQAFYGYTLVTWLHKIAE